ncbi:MAG: DUF4175 family protein [Bacteroidota bacterium]|nr:hypothetical protein [Candidatus Kapabacteria bacterium]MDW8219077.1 DUF4175 family protein [Bacteroidota bacterium]
MENTEHQAVYERILRRLRTVRSKEHWLMLSTGILQACAYSLVVLLSVTGIEALMYSNVLSRTILFAVWFLSTLCFVGAFAGKSMLQLLGIYPSDSSDTIALRIGKVYSTVQDRLLNALQLYRDAIEQRSSSPELAVAHFAAVAAQAETLDFDAILDKKPRRTALMMFLGSILLAGLVFAVFPKPMGTALYRVLHFRQSFIPPAPFILVLEPAQYRVLRGAKMEITVHTVPNPEAPEYQPPAEVMLRLRERTSAAVENTPFETFTLRPDSEGVFRFHVSAVKRSIEAYAEVPWYFDVVRSEKVMITVIDRPEIRSLAGTVMPPTYTRMSPYPIDEHSASITSLIGSRVELTVMSNKKLKAAEILLLEHRDDKDSTRYGDSTRIPMKVLEHRALGVFAVQHSGEYCIRIVDENGEENAEPIRYSILALRDAFPSIALLQPSSNIELTETGLLPIKVAIADDYGFSKLVLYYRRVESRYSPPQQSWNQIPIHFSAGSEKSLEVPYVWNLNALGLAPSDTYEFYLEVSDNDAVNGPKSSRTGIITARLPSLDELFNEADKIQDLAAKDLHKVLKDAEQMKRDMEDVARELRKQQDKPQVDWKEKKRLEDLLKKHEDMQKRIENVQKQLEEMTQKLQQNRSISPETLQQYLEVQKLLQKVNSPELQRAMQQMQRALDQMQPEQLQQALQKFQFSEEEFKRSIERTMRILKRVQANQKSDELAKRAKELEEQQQDMEQQLNNANLNDPQKRQELAERQQKLKEDFQALSKETDELEQLMKEIQEKGGRDMPMEEMNKAQEALRKEETEQAMQETTEYMRRGDQTRAQERQKQARQNLQQFAQQMQHLKREMQRNVQQEAIRQLQKATHNMLELSKRQEQLKQQSQNMDYNSTQFRDAAQDQANALQDLRNVIGRMIELSQKSFAVTPEMGKELGDALQHMDNAVHSLEERNAQQSSQHQSAAMSAMNRAIAQMQSMLGQMQQGNGPGGQQPGEEGEGQGQGGMASFMERLQQAASQQQAVNQALQQMMQMQQEGQSRQRLGQPSAEDVGRVAAQQEAIRKSLEELAKEQKGGKRALGDLQKIAQEMQEIVSDMRSGQISEETLRRQERILSRLLDAARSTREQDIEQQREAKTGQNTARQSPAAIDLRTQEGRTRALQELLRSAQQGYTKDYESLIQRYFEALQKIPVPVQQ